MQGTLRRNERRQHVQPNLSNKHRGPDLTLHGCFLKLIPTDVMRVQAFVVMEVTDVTRLAQIQQFRVMIAVIFVVRMKYRESVRRHKCHRKHQD